MGAPLDHFCSIFSVYIEVFRGNKKKNLFPYKQISLYKFSCPGPSEAKGCALITFKAMQA